MAEPSTRTVERALQLLGAVCDAGFLTLADAARGDGTFRVHGLRLLRTLENTGFVRKDEEGDYRPGLRHGPARRPGAEPRVIISLAEPALNGSWMPPANRPTSRCAATTAPAKTTGSYIAIAEGTHSVRHASWVGRTVPLEGSAAGAVLSGKTPESGYVVVDRGVEADVTAIAAPIAVGMHAPDGTATGHPGHRAP